MNQKIKDRTLFVHFRTVLFFCQKTAKKTRISILNKKVRKKYARNYHIVNLITYNVCIFVRSYTF